MNFDEFLNQLFALVFLLAGFSATWFAYELILKWWRNKNEDNQ